MNSLDAMRIYVSVAELASFTQAADSLHLPKANVSGAVKQLETELDRLIIDSEWRLKLGESARTRVKESFGMERMVKELEELYFLTA